MKPSDVYKLGWQMLHLLEACHSTGYVYNNVKFDWIFFIDNLLLNSKDVDFSQHCLALADLSLCTPYVSFNDRNKHLK